MNKIIKRRPLSGNSTPLLDRLYRARNIKSVDELDRGLGAMLNPNLLHGIKQAVSLLIEARQQQHKIVIVGDFDADGATSTALAMAALKMLGFDNVDFLVPNRFEQGYGLSIPVAELALQKQVQLLMTVDLIWRSY